MPSFWTIASQTLKREVYSRGYRWEVKMAYGNYGAIVRRNGERMGTHEDQTPYREAELEAGYHQAFGRLETELSPHHAVLGSGKVRLCAHKTSPILYLNGERVPIRAFSENWKSIDYGSKEENGSWLNEEEHFSEETAALGTIEDCIFKIWMGGDPRRNTLHLRLTEPDGTHWEAESAYEYGAGHDPVKLDSQLRTP